MWHFFQGCTLDVRKEEVTLMNFFSYGNQVYPPAISDNGILYFDTKSDLLSCSPHHSCQYEAPKVGNTIIDGAVVVQMLKPTAIKKFNEYACQVFIPFIMLQFQNVLCLDIVWDRYLGNTLKSTTRAK